MLGLENMLNALMVAETWDLQCYRPSASIVLMDMAIGLHGTSMFLPIRGTSLARMPLER